MFSKTKHKQKLLNTLKNSLFILATKNFAAIEVRPRYARALHCGDAHLQSQGDLAKVRVGSRYVFVKKYNLI